MTQDNPSSRRRASAPNLPESTCGEEAEVITAGATAPQNLEAERSVLGAMLQGAYAIDAVLETGLTADHFYFDRHGQLYALMAGMHERGIPVDVISVTDELERLDLARPVGGTIQLNELVALTPATLNAAHHAGLVRDSARRRAELRAGQALAAASANGGLRDHPEVAEQLTAVLSDDAVSPDGLDALDLSELLSGEPPVTDWLWAQWLAKGDLALLVGDPGVGKSLLSLGLAVAIRRGRSFLGEPCARGVVGVFDFENPIGEAHKRLRGIGLTADDHDGIIYFHGPQLDLTARAGRDALATAIRTYDLDLLVIDSLRRAAPGLDENDSAAVSTLFSPLRKLTVDTGRAILVVHHPRKRTAEGSTEGTQMVRGSGDLVASVDSLLFARAKQGGMFTLEHAKSRRGLPHEPILVRIESEGERIGVVSEGPVAMAEDKVEALLARVLACLRDNGGALHRPIIATKLGVDSRNSTFTRALKLGYDRDQLAKEEGAVGNPTTYSLAPMIYGAAA